MRAPAALPSVFVLFAAVGLAAPEEDQDSRREELLELVEGVVARKARAPRFLDGLDPRRLSVEDHELFLRLRRERLSVDFPGTELELVVDFLRKATRMNIIFTAKAWKKIRAERPRVELALKNLPLRDIFQHLIESAVPADRLLGGGPPAGGQPAARAETEAGKTGTSKAGYGVTLRSGAIVIGLPGEVRPRPVLVIYSVTDLVRRPPDFRPPRMSLVREDRD